MEALNILASAQDRVEELGISEKTQERIKWFISQGNLGTKNAQKLILWINEERNKNPEDFDRKYPGLYNHIQSEHQKYTSSEKGQSQIQSAEENMDSIYETVMDPNKSWSEKIGVIAKDPLILFAAGTLFLFGVF